MIKKERMRRRKEGRKTLEEGGDIRGGEMADADGDDDDNNVKVR